jgi:hypothetical protein
VGFWPVGTESNSETLLRAAASQADHRSREIVAATYFEPLTESLFLKMHIFQGGFGVCLLIHFSGKKPRG